MTKDITVWMPFYVADYLRDTGHLSTVEHGAYMLLLFHYWATGKPLPDDDIVLARIARMTPDEWDAHADTLKAFFRVRHGRLFHKRVDAEIRKAKAKRQALSERGKKGAKQKWEKNARKTAQQHPVSDANFRHKKERQNNDLDATATSQAMLKRMLADAPSPSPSPKPIENRKPMGGANAPADKKVYGFVGKAIRVAEADLAKWRETFFGIPDLQAELRAADAYYHENPPKNGKWFFPVSNWLKKAHNEALAAKNADRAAEEAAYRGLQ